MAIDFSDGAEFSLSGEITDQEAAAQLQRLYSAGGDHVEMSVEDGRWFVIDELGKTPVREKLGSVLEHSKTLSKFGGSRD